MKSPFSVQTFEQGVWTLWGNPTRELPPGTLVRVLEGNSPVFDLFGHFTRFLLEVRPAGDGAKQVIEGEFDPSAFVCLSLPDIPTGDDLSTLRILGPRILSDMLREELMEMDRGFKRWKVRWRDSHIVVHASFTTVWTEHDRIMEKRKDR